MSLSYNGTTSALTAGATQTWGNAFSYATWFQAVSEGESNVGALFQHGSTDRMRLHWNGTSGKKLRYHATFSGANSSWDLTSAFASITVWIWIGVTYDGSNTTNDPTIYTLVGNTFSTLTVGSGLTENTAPVGAIIADNLTCYVGNNSAGSATWDGLIGESAQWKRVLTAEEMEAVATLGVNAVPDHFNYLPQDSGTAQNLGSSATAFTASNTTTGENPPTRPAGRRG
jgi:hypothetical protein